MPVCSWSRLHNCCGEWGDWDPVNRFNYYSWLAVVTPTDCYYKSVHNCCAIEVLGGVFVLSRCLQDFSVCVGAFVIHVGTESIFPFLFMI